MGKSTISMAIFNSFLYVYQRVAPIFGDWIPRYHRTVLRLTTVPGVWSLLHLESWKTTGKESDIRDCISTMFTYVIMISRCHYIWDFPWPCYFYNLQLGPRTQLVWYGSGGLVPANHPPESGTWNPNKMSFGLTRHKPSPNFLGVHEIGVYLV